MAEQRWLRAGIAGKPEAVDKQAKVLRGYVVAQAGPFKSQGRGEFDRQSLDTIVAMGNAAPKGLKSRLGHPGMSEDGIGKFLGRSTDFRNSNAVSSTMGKLVAAVRADLHFDPTAHDTPHGDLAGYVLGLAESDPDAISSSLVLQVDEEWRIDKKGVPLTDDNGDPLPPLWRPTKLHASDIVDTGDAVDGLLSAELSSALSQSLATGGIDTRLLRFDNLQRLAYLAMDNMFATMERDEINKRLLAFAARYLDQRFGEEEVIATPKLDKYKERLNPLAEYVERGMATEWGKLKT